MAKSGAPTLVPRAALQQLETTPPASVRAKPAMLSPVTLVLQLMMAPETVMPKGPWASLLPLS